MHGLARAIRESEAAVFWDLFGDGWATPGARDRVDVDALVREIGVDSVGRRPYSAAEVGG
jgi:hypothetical protein